ncbi:hypothetical protein NHN26_06300, partial [Rhodovulum tesquicola]|uniref:hypothetical protein n=1 Tax=Rhodovulum tesquicola TaxID=540254 RepID=UPI0020985BE0
ICHQLHSLKLELLRELPSYHVRSPGPWSRSYLRVHETGSRPPATLFVLVFLGGKLSKLSRKRGPPQEHRRTILARLRKSDIQPFSSGGRDFGHLYLRKEVERAFPL